ncbi:MAG: hypothetical protein ACRCXB_20840 [Aeromonadaceae bacterium]
MRTLYRKGDREEVWGVKFDYAEFEDSQVDAALADGWVKTPLELKQQDERHHPADTNVDGKLSAEEAKAYLDSIGVDYSGLHWKKVVALAEQHVRGE